ncbi:MAG TPA: outer membrane lipoprotein-sorting protein, partial [Verrucomicrobiota bacterium]|nr:outer membrane lipoprotein-sorting protein [Verrucomicrobiota bacterium]
PSRLAAARLLLRLLLSAGLALPAAAAPPTGDARGAELAALLRTARPAEATTLTAQMRHRPARGARVVTPLRIATRPAADGWTVTYEPAAGAAHRVRFDGAAPPRYERLVGGATVPVGAETPLPGSDFFLGDLGLDFLFWPEQRVLRRELRRSRWCEVLESTAPPGARLPYARVVTWVDDETGGFIRAEAYDAGGRRWKVFAPGGIRRNAARDGYELKDMEISDVLADSFTVLEFDRAAAVPAGGPP